MAFFPQVNDLEQLKGLDGWLLNALGSAVKKRGTVLDLQHGIASYPFLNSSQLLEAKWYDAVATGIHNDVRLPSFVRAWKYANRGLNAFNLSEFPARSFPSGDEELY